MKREKSRRSFQKIEEWYENNLEVQEQENRESWLILNNVRFSENSLELKELKNKTEGKVKIEKDGRKILGQRA
jgi:hypothetical protein